MSIEERLRAADIPFVVEHIMSHQKQGIRYIFSGPGAAERASQTLNMEITYLRNNTFSLDLI